METNKVDDETELLVVLDFVDVDSLALWLQGVLCLALYRLFFSERVDSNLSIHRFPVNSAES